jgi:hypothetical protein
MSVVEEIESNLESCNYSKAITSANCNNRTTAIQDEIESHKNGTWNLVKLTKYKRPYIVNGFKKNGDTYSSEPARLVAKGYNQIPGIDFNDIFSLVITY